MELIQLTEPAAAKLRQHLERRGRAGEALRVKVTGGGCSGLRYELLFESSVTPSDEELEHHGVRILVDAKSAVFLAGTTVDYVDGLNESGFKIVNPNAKTTCGCGESFGA
jgi:iron-sulfur cluster assembly accessory protein